MRRSALIVADDPTYRNWLGNNVSTRWPKIVLEYSRLANAGLYLDRARIERYQLIVVRLSAMSFAEMTLGILLIRILNTDNPPAILLIAESEEQLRAARSTKLRQATCLLAQGLNVTVMQEALGNIVVDTDISAGETANGAPEIPGYVVRKALAGTYTSTIYVAHSQALGHDVALKVTELQSNNKSAAWQMSLHDEFLVLRKLGGDHVGKAYEYGEVGGLGYLAMEYFPKGSIGRYIAESGRKSSRFDIMLAVAEALRYVHDAGFLHLDLKPNNILMRDGGKPALIDFGISKRILVAEYLERRSYSMGSPYFMSPEQCDGASLDARSDIYSFGAVWYYVFTGRPPFRGRTFEEIQLARERVGTPSLGFSLRHYQAIVDKTLAVNRDDRYQSVSELIDGLYECSASATGVHRRLDIDAYVQEMERT